MWDSMSYNCFMIKKCLMLGRFWQQFFDTMLIVVILQALVHVGESHRGQQYVVYRFPISHPREMKFELQ